MGTTTHLSVRLSEHRLAGLLSCLLRLRGRRSTDTRRRTCLRTLPVRHLETPQASPYAAMLNYVPKSKQDLKTAIPQPSEPHSNTTTNLIEHQTNQNHRDIADTNTKYLHCCPQNNRNAESLQNRRNLCLLCKMRIFQIH